MSARFLPVAPQQFFDNDGKVVSGGMVGYYIPATLTLKSVWSDAAQAVAKNNPVLLGSDGRPDDSLSIYGEGTYRQIVWDSLGNRISDLTIEVDESGGGGSAQDVDTIQALRDLDESGHVDNQLFNVAGYWDAGDGLGGPIMQFVWREDDDRDENGGTVIRPTTAPATGRYVRNTELRAKFWVNWFGAIADRVSHPLSEKFGSDLAACQLIYPFVTALTQTVDWAARQGSSIWGYDNTVSRGVYDSGNLQYNWASFVAIHDGQYVVGDTTIWSGVAIVLEGEVPYVSSLGGVTNITYNGANGTLDDNLAIDYCGGNRENGTTPMMPGQKLAFNGQTELKTHRITYTGKGGNMGSLTPDVSGYINGIRISTGGLCITDQCQFRGTLYDGIVYTGAQVFAEVRNCWFGGCHRDDISVRAIAGNFTTTTWFHHNEHGFNGRYAHMGHYGGVEALAVCNNNSYEGYYESYWVLNPEWFAQGAVCGTYYTACGNMVIRDDRSENGTDVTPGMYADIHLNGCYGAHVQDCTSRSIMLTGNSAAAQTTAAFTAYVASHLYSDLTNQRNYNLPANSADQLANCQDLKLDNIYNLNRIIFVDEIVPPAGTHHYRDVNFRLLSVPSKAGTYARIVEPRQTAVPTLMNPNGYAWQAENCTVTDFGGTRLYHYYHNTSGNGSATIFLSFSRWAANTVYNATMGASGENYGTYLKPLTDNGYVYQVISPATGGQTGGAEPVWPVVVGNTVVNGTLTLKCVNGPGIIYEAEVGGAIENMLLYGKRFMNGTAASTQGYHFQGETMQNREPTAAGVDHWRCVVAGVPGTWSSVALS